MKNFKYRSIEFGYPLPVAGKWSDIVDAEKLQAILDVYDPQAIFSGPGVYPVSDKISLEVITTDPPANSPAATHAITGMFRPVNRSETFELVAFSRPVLAIQVSEFVFRVHPDQYVAEIVSEDLEAVAALVATPILAAQPAAIDSDWIFCDFDGDRLAAAQSKKAG